MYIIGIFYFTLGNVQPKFRSKLSTIQLVAIVESPVLMSYGMDAVLLPIVNDIKKLVRGCVVCVHARMCELLLCTCV